MPFAPLDVIPDSKLVVVMSDPNYLSISVSRADGMYDADYIEIYGDVFTPKTPGVYYYKIEVSYKKGAALLHRGAGAGPGPADGGVKPAPCGKRTEKSGRRIFRRPLLLVFWVVKEAACGPALSQRSGLGRGGGNHPGGCASAV